MGRSSNQNITYPSLGISREIYFTYVSDINRPKPAELLEFAMCAYMEIQSNREVTYETLLEMKRQLTTVFKESRRQQSEVTKEIERAEKAEEAAREKKLRLQVNECFIVLNLRTPPFTEPKTIKEVEYNEKVCDHVRSRLFERYQIQPSNVSDEFILNVYFESHPGGV